MAPANALALSDLDTKFRVKADEQGREQHLRCDLLTITNGTLICRNGNLDDRIPLSHVKQLDVEYMGKLYIVSDMNTDNINSANIMSANKEEAFSRQEKVGRERVSSSGPTRLSVRYEHPSNNNSLKKMPPVDWKKIVSDAVDSGNLDQYYATQSKTEEPDHLEEFRKRVEKDIAENNLSLSSVNIPEPPDNKEAKGGWFKGWFGPSNYFECILDKMPGVKNDTVASETMQICRKEFPNQSEVKKKSAIIGIKNSSECVLKYAKDETSPLSARLIKAACYKLYPKE
ncbi:hypothetical protein [Candidatus Electronema sp. JM]|uniref:hypothetical protein n=1 Tax=Candidatus Electronema sp. JM TaxID=3401571 RepID=UPI003AA8DC77